MCALRGTVCMSLLRWATSVGRLRGSDGGSSCSIGYFLKWQLQQIHMHRAYVCIVRNIRKSMKHCSCGRSSTMDALMYQPKVHFDSFHALHSSLFRYMPQEKNKIVISTGTRERKTQLLLFRSLTPKPMLCRSSKFFQDARCSGYPILQPYGCFLQTARALDGSFL